MSNISDIPGEVRWEIATRAANYQSVAYDMLVRQIIGDKIDEIWKAIMTEGGKESRAMAESLGLPSGNAIEVDSALGSISTILLGPELISELVEEDKERVLGRITSCPMLNAHRRFEPGTMEGTPAHCQAFCQSAVESLNPRFTIRYLKRMCTGDPSCEYIILPREQSGRE